MRCPKCETDTPLSAVPIPGTEQGLTLGCVRCGWIQSESPLRPRLSETSKVKAGVIPAAGLQFSLRAEEHLVAQELGFQISSQEVFQDVYLLVRCRHERDEAHRRATKALADYNHWEKEVVRLEKLLKYLYGSEGEGEGEI